MQRLSIVIPAWGNEQSFEATLLSVLESRPSDCEILVPQCGDYEDPYNLSDEVRFLEPDNAASGIDLLNAGLQNARGEIVHVLSAGMQVEADWTRSAVNRFRDKLLASLSPLLIDAERQRINSLGIAYSASGTRKVVCQGAKYRPDKLPRKKVLGPTLAAGYYRREALLEIGGWHATVGDSLADVDLALSLHAQGWTAEFAAESTIICDTAPETQEASFGQAWNNERLFWRHASEIGWGKSLLMHPLAIGWESLTALPTLATLTQPLGRLLALVELPRNLAFAGKLDRHEFLLEAVGETDVEEAVIPFPESATADRSDPPSPLSKAS